MTPTRTMTVEDLLELSDQWLAEGTGHAAWRRPAYRALKYKRVFLGKNKLRHGHFYAMMVPEVYALGAGLTRMGALNWLTFRLGLPPEPEGGGQLGLGLTRENWTNQSG